MEKVAEEEARISCSPSPCVNHRKKSQATLHTSVPPQSPHPKPLAD